MAFFILVGRLRFAVKLSKILLIPDVHIPFENPKSYKLLLKVSKDLNPSEIYLLGDYADFYSVSSFPKDKRLPSMLSHEISAVQDKFSELRAMFPKAKITYLLGNHEYRLLKYIAANCPALLESLNVESMLLSEPRVGTRQRAAVRFVAYGPSQCVRVGKSSLWARHEPLGASPKATISKSLCSLVYGHIHRIEEVYSVGMNGQGITAFSIGWLGDKDSPAFEYVKTHHQWQQGFAVVYVNDRTRAFFHQTIRIIDGQCVFNGKLYT